MLMLQSKQLCIIILFYAQIFHCAHSHTKNYCESMIDINRYSKKLHFMGEIGDLDFGLVNMTKTLHCCANGFTNIIWLKNKKPYPWSPATSSFVADESANNQTLVSKRARISDSGIYTCIVRDETTMIKHEIDLQILAPELAEFPRMTYPIKDQTGNIGDFARLYCEGFVGKGKKTNNMSGTITWEKGLSDRFLDRAFIDGSRVIQANYHRDENQILSSHLVFMKVEPQDLSMYTCRITNGNYRAVELRAWILDSRDPEELARLFFLALYAILPMFTLASILALLAGLVLPIEIVETWIRRFKVHFPGAQGKRKDILVVYHMKDQKLMSKTIVPKFQKLHPIKVTLYPVHGKQEDFNKLVKKAKTYDGVMVIMTSSLTGNEWTCENIYYSIKVISKLKPMFCVFTKKLPPFKGKSGQKLKEALKQAEFDVINWKKNLNEKVLRAYLKQMDKKIKEYCAKYPDTENDKSGEKLV